MRKTSNTSKKVQSCLMQKKMKLIAKKRATGGGNYICYIGLLLLIGTLLFLSSCKNTYIIPPPGIWNPSEKSFTVTFEPNLPTGVSEDKLTEMPESIEVKSGQTLDSSIAPKLADGAGYAFNGWLTAEGEAFTSDTKITSDITLYASWISTWDGTSSDTAFYYDNPDANEYSISTTAELRGLAELVNGGNDFSGKTIILENDIDLGNHEWTPIGIAGNAFKGTFRGKTDEKTEIRNLKITNPTQVTQSSVYGAGLFGFIKDAIISNLHINGEIDISATDKDVRAGSVAGYANDSTIENCVSDTAIKTSGKWTYSGGIAGYINNTKVIFSNNRGKIEGYGFEQSQCGGIVALVYGTSSINNCRNEGDVYAENTPEVNGDQDGIGCMAGGIAGYQEMGSGENSISKCTNTGNVTAKENGHNNSDAGGIVGYVLNLYNKNASIIISECINDGDVLSIYNGGEFNHSQYGQYAYAAFGGGITGTLLNYQAASDIKISGCKNYGSVTGESNATTTELKSSAIGGIVGIMQNIQGTITVKGNHNEGLLSTVMDIGYAVAVIVEASPVDVSNNTDGTTQGLNEIGFTQKI